MKRVVWASGLVTLFACAPDLDVKASRVLQTRVVAVRATPAEARPGTTVTLQAIVVTPLPTPASRQIDWAFCNVPRSPSDSITVNAACLRPLDPSVPALTQIEGATGDVARAQVPIDACRTIGPELPPTDEMGNPQRPPDADITGGYQLPVRLVLSDSTGVDISFDRQRVRCNLGNAPSSAATEYQQRYMDNQNPAFTSIVFAGSPAPADGSARFAVPRGGQYPIRVTWDASAAENYVLFDPTTRSIQDRRERLEIGWFTNGGSFERDRTTPDDESSTSNELSLDSDVTEPVTVWIVLRDERGGVGVTTLVLEPT
ncbi:MAG TPA: hypothetical protein VI299_25110 [Polyangiales bacterium]